MTDQDLAVRIRRIYDETDAVTLETVTVAHPAWKRPPYVVLAAAAVILVVVGIGVLTVRSLHRSAEVTTKGEKADVSVYVHADKTTLRIGEDLTLDVTFVNRTGKPIEECQGVFPGLALVRSIAPGNVWSPPLGSGGICSANSVLKAGTTTSRVTLPGQSICSDSRIGGRSGIQPGPNCPPGYFKVAPEGLGGDLTEAVSGPTITIEPDPLIAGTVPVQADPLFANSDGVLEGRVSSVDNTRIPEEITFTGEVGVGKSETTSTVTADVVDGVYEVALPAGTWWSGNSGGTCDVTHLVTERVRKRDDIYVSANGSGCAAPLPGSSTVAPSAGTVTITLDRPIVSRGQAITGKVVAVNNGTAPLPVPGWRGVLMSGGTSPVKAGNFAKVVTSLPPGQSTFPFSLSPQGCPPEVGCPPLLSGGPYRISLADTSHDPDEPLAVVTVVDDPLDGSAFNPAKVEPGAGQVTGTVTPAPGSDVPSTVQFLSVSVDPARGSSDVVTANVVNGVYEVELPAGQWAIAISPGNLCGDDVTVRAGKWQRHDINACQG